MKLDAERQLQTPSQRLAWWLGLARAMWHRKERRTVTALGRFIPPYAVIFDIGSHFGYFAKEFARLHGRSCRVHCFEPFAYSYSILGATVRKYRNVVLHPYGLSETAGRTSLQVPVRRTGKVGPSLAHLGPEAQRDFIAVAVQLETLDRFAAASQIDRLDFIKCDVEGAELLVFRGGIDTLRSLHPVVYCEVSAAYTERLGYAPADLFAFFQGLGYLSWQVLAPFGLERCARYRTPGNYLFAPQTDARFIDEGGRESGREERSRRSGAE